MRRHIAKKGQSDPQSQLRSLFDFFPDLVGERCRIERWRDTRCTQMAFYLQPSSPLPISLQRPRVRRCPFSGSKRAHTNTFVVSPSCANWISLRIQFRRLKLEAPDFLRRERIERRDRSQPRFPLFLFHLATIFSPRFLLPFSRPLFGTTAE